VKTLLLKIPSPMRRVSGSLSKYKNSPKNIAETSKKAAKTTSKTSKSDAGKITKSNQSYPQNNGKEKTNEALQLSACILQVKIP